MRMHYHILLFQNNSTTSQIWKKEASIALRNIQRGLLELTQIPTFMVSSQFRWRKACMVSTTILIDQDGLSIHNSILHSSLPTLKLLPLVEETVLHWPASAKISSFVLVAPPCQVINSMEPLLCTTLRKMSGFLAPPWLSRDTITLAAPLAKCSMQSVVPHSLRTWAVSRQLMLIFWRQSRKMPQQPDGQRSISAALVPFSSTFNTNSALWLQLLTKRILLYWAALPLSKHFLSSMLEYKQCRLFEEMLE